MWWGPLKYFGICHPVGTSGTVGAMDAVRAQQMVNQIVSRLLCAQRSSVGNTETCAAFLQLLLGAVSDDAAFLVTYLLGRRGR